MKRAGFTLMETLFALTLSAVLGTLVATVFLVQNQTYADQRRRIAASQNVRGVIQALNAQLSMSTAGGITQADSVTIKVRTPMAVGAVCAHKGGGDVIIHVEGGRDELDTAHVSGVGVSDGAGGWSNYDDAWSDLIENDTDGAEDCADEATDTAGIYEDFVEFDRVDGYHGSRPPIGTLMMLYRETEFAFDTSALNVGTSALYKGNSVDGLREFASGLDSVFFSFRVGGIYYDYVDSPDTVEIEAVHVRVVSVLEAITGGREATPVGLSATIHLGNAR